jgi:pimeloyl-ACP methyl ester carboxylesterase
MTTSRIVTLENRSFVLLSYLAAILGLSLLASSLTAAHARAKDDTKPTIVLVHGAWADASSWDAEIATLEHAGYPVIAPANPLRGLASDSDYLSSILDTIPGPVVLVGHSYGGAVITQAAASHANVKALVYIAAFIPVVGETAFAEVSMFPGSQLVPPGLPGANLIPRPYTKPDNSTGTDLYIDPAAFAQVFAADVPPPTEALMAATQRPLELSALQEPAKAAAWKTIPSWAMVATEDHAVGADNARFMAQRAGATIVEVKASHAVLVSRPDDVSTLIETAADSVRP